MSSGWIGVGNGEGRNAAVLAAPAVAARRLPWGGLMSGPPKSLATRLFLMAAFWSVVAVAFAAVFLSTLYQRSVERGFDERLGVYIKVLVGALAPDGEQEGGATDVGNLLGEPRFALPYSGWYWVVTGTDSGDVVLASDSLAGDTLRLPSGEKGTQTAAGYWQAYEAGPAGEELRVLERRIVFPDNKGYKIAVAGNASDINRDVSAFRYSVAATLAVLGLGLIAGIVLQVRIGLRPLGRMREALAAIRSGNKDRLDGVYPSDIAPLADELNALIDSNRQVVERSRTHVGNLAHALKTPLSVVINEARAQGGPFATKVVEQCAQMQDQIGHHLDRARMAAQRRVIGAVTDMPEVSSRLIRAMQRIYGGRDITIDLHCAPDLRFAGEQQDLEEMLGNLVDNACKWAGRSVSVHIDRRDDRNQAGRAFARILVDDDGPGLSRQERSEALKRGKRLDETVPGSGLGLSIVVDLATLYGGQLSLDQAPEGGLRAILDLPIV